MHEPVAGDGVARVVDDCLAACQCAPAIRSDDPNICWAELQSGGYVGFEWRPDECRLHVFALVGSAAQGDDGETDDDEFPFDETIEFVREDDATWCLHIDSVAREATLDLSLTAEALTPGVLAHHLEAFCTWQETWKTVFGAPQADGVPPQHPGPFAEATATLLWV